MSRYDENSKTELEQEMLTFEEPVMCGNLLQRSGSGSEPHLESNREFGPVANTRLTLTINDLESFISICCMP